MTKRCCKLEIRGLTAAILACNDGGIGVGLEGAERRAEKDIRAGGDCSWWLLFISDERVVEGDDEEEEDEIRLSINFRRG